MMLLSMKVILAKDLTLSSASFRVQGEVLAGTDIEGLICLRRLLTLLSNVHRQQSGPSVVWLNAVLF